jgi:sigma-B regulation protein RsbU (phosphoserine phosphatase)
MAFEARLRVLAEEAGNAASLVQRLNKVTCANCPSNRFITFFFGIVDPAKGDLAFANAGHNPPVLVRASGKVEMLEGGGPVLGVLEIAPYKEDRTKLGPGDVLVIYSDGVTEAASTAEEEYGEQRLMDVVAQHRTEPADAIVKAVMDSVSQFSLGAAQADDITVVVAKRL